MDGIGVAGEVVTAGTALAGLILIYIGSLVTGYGSYQATERRTVQVKFLSRAWLAFVGFILALAAAGFAIVGKWIAIACVADAAVWILLLAFAWTAAITAASIREMS